MNVKCVCDCSLRAKKRYIPGILRTPNTEISKLTGFASLPLLRFVLKRAMFSFGVLLCANELFTEKLRDAQVAQKSNPRGLGLLCLLSKPRPSEAQRAHLSSSCTETLNSNSSAPNQNHWDSCLEREIDFSSWAYLFKHEERFSSDLNSVQAIYCLPATCLRHRYTWKKKKTYLWTFTNSCMGKSAKYCEYKQNTVRLRNAFEHLKRIF